MDALPVVPLSAVLGTLLAIAALDALWLGLIARGFYRRELGPLLAERVRPWPALLFYLGYPLGVALLALSPWPATAAAAAARGALVGLVAYGTYDLTNLATLRGIRPRLALVDIAWGALASAAGAAAGWALAGALR